MSPQENVTPDAEHNSGATEIPLPLQAGDNKKVGPKVRITAANPTSRWRNTDLLYNIYEYNILNEGSVKNVVMAFVIVCPLTF